MATVVDAPVTLAAVLRQLADGLDQAAALGVADMALTVNVQPYAGDDEATVRAVDVLGWTLLGCCGRPELMSTSAVHYTAAGHVGLVSVAVFRSVSATGTVAEPLRSVLDSTGGVS